METCLKTCLVTSTTYRCYNPSASDPPKTNPMTQSFTSMSPLLSSYSGAYNDSRIL